MSDWQVAFFIGLFGSVHCIGMCGPLMLAVPFNGRSAWLLAFDKLLYQLGRTLSYVILGLIIGLIGKQIWLANIQNGLSIVSGALIILAALSRLFKHSFKSPGIAIKLTRPFNTMLVWALKKRAGHLLTGMLNGLLPCGFVYLALVGAVNTGSVLASAGFMFWFGMGTLPLMFAAAFSSGFFTVSLRRKLNTIVPYFMLCLGLWFVLRGLELNVPYLSPAGMDAPAICK
ncbi:sulfite exporter TauE/SafE family protein [Mucilaginibacter sp. JRF]|uniref:sulfite exporter TauE/SafE family protein n=1 Tax=Mucilaginibacter sp. JRF TaxID=2780088 RepID=UPI00187E4F88|nr:sulfite exporter TauE/SafE family protein [Mucilaginibacter sp. JRF]MBE9584066.1 sulfite exporter TauE/SafE family protein [Mucilaginibacter sp. JRF]